MKIFLFICFLGQTLLADPVLPKDSYVAFIHEGNYCVIGKDSIYNSGDGIVWSSRKHHFDIRPGELISLNKKDTVYLLGRGGGKVYEFVNDTVRRIDRSFEWRSRYYADLFVRKGTITSFAGTGLFAEKNNFIYYHPKSREWFEYYAINSDIVYPVSVPAGFYEPTTDRYIFTLGRSKRYDGKVSYTENRQVYCFDFSKRVWSIEGEIPEDLELDDYRVVKNYTEPLVFNKNHLYRFDFIQGLLYEYRSDNILSILENTSYIVYNGQKKTFLVMDSEGFNVRPLVIAEQELLGDIKTITSLRPDSPWSYWPYLLLMVPVFIWGYYRFGRKQKIGPELDIEALMEMLDREDALILSKIMDKHPEPITFPELKQVYDDSFSYESRIKKLRDSLQNIEKQVQHLRPVDHAYINIVRNKSDKRIKEVTFKM